jgi:hypothetical protein
MKSSSSSPLFWVLVDDDGKDTASVSLLPGYVDDSFGYADGENDGENDSAVGVYAIRLHRSAVDGPCKVKTFKSQLGLIKFLREEGLVTDGGVSDDGVVCVDGLEFVGFHGSKWSYRRTERRLLSGLAISD